MASCQLDYESSKCILNWITVVLSTGGGVWWGLKAGPPWLQLTTAPGMATPAPTGEANVGSPSDVNEGHVRGSSYILVLPSKTPAGPEIPSDIYKPGALSTFPGWNVTNLNTLPVGQESIFILPRSTHRQLIPSNMYKMLRSGPGLESEPFLM